MSSRKALTASTLLLTLFEPCLPEFEQTWFDTLLKQWQQHISKTEGQHRAAYMASEGGWCALVSWWPRGDQARESWTQFRCSQAWRQASVQIASQPIIFLLAETQSDWDQVERLTLTCATREASVETRADRRSGKRPGMALPTREALPSLEKTQIWPVIGHPGRVLTASELKVGEVLQEAWGPLCEEIQVWTGGVSVQRGS